MTGAAWTYRGLPALDLRPQPAAFAYFVPARSLEDSSRGRPLLDDVSAQAQHGLRFELANARGMDAQDFGDLVQVLFFLEVQRKDGALQPRHSVYGVGQEFFEFGALEDAGREIFLVLGDVAEQLAFGEPVGDFVEAAQADAA